MRHALCVIIVCTMERGLIRRAFADLERSLARTLSRPGQLLKAARLLDQVVCEIRSSWPGWECTTDVHNANTIWRHFVEHTILIEA